MEKHISKSILKLHGEYNCLYSQLKKEYTQFIKDAVLEFGGEDKAIVFDHDFETENISVMREEGWECVQAVFYDEELRQVVVDLEWSTDELCYFSPDELATIAGAVESYINRDHDDEVIDDGWFEYKD